MAIGAADSMADAASVHDLAGDDMLIDIGEWIDWAISIWLAWAMGLRERWAQ